MKLMKKFFAVISGAGFLLSVGLSNAPAARAESACTNATLTDGFGIQVTGPVLEGAPRPPGPFAGNGLLNFDGNGNLTTSLTISLNGSIAPFKGSGTYNVEESCTLTAQFTDELSGTEISISGVIVKRGTEILIIQTDPNRVVTGILKKVD